MTVGVDCPPWETFPIPPTTECGGCTAMIKWGWSETTGKRMPIDVPEDPNGNCVWLPNSNIHVLSQDEMHGSLLVEPDRRPRHMPHFATCPKADYYRRRCPTCKQSPCVCEK